MSKEPKRNVYVGHRYVPKIMGEWNKEQSYEGLSIVTHQGTSYTSKKHVPVGIDISDEEYWAVTGNYNAQIEHYRKEVKDMGDYVDREVNDLTNYVNSEVTETKNEIAENLNVVNAELEKRVTNEKLYEDKRSLVKEYEFENMPLMEVRSDVYNITYGVTDPSINNKKSLKIEAIDYESSLDKTKDFAFILTEHITNKDTIDISFYSYTTEDNKSLDVRFAYSEPVNIPLGKGNQWNKISFTLKPKDMWRFSSWFYMDMLSSYTLYISDLQIHRRNESNIITDNPPVSVHDIHDKLMELPSTINNSVGIIERMIKVGQSYMDNLDKFVYGFSGTAYDRTLTNENNKFQIDCSTFASLMMKGVTFENSRYNGNDENISNPLFFNNLDPYKVRYANQIAKYGYEKGYAFIPEKDMSNVQPGDLLFFSWNTYDESLPTDQAREVRENSFMQIDHVCVFLHKKADNQWQTLQVNTAMNNVYVTATDHYMSQAVLAVRFPFSNVESPYHENNILIDGDIPKTNEGNNYRVGRYTLTKSMTYGNYYTLFINADMLEEDNYIIIESKNGEIIYSDWGRKNKEYDGTVVIRFPYLKSYDSDEIYISLGSPSDTRKGTINWVSLYEGYKRNKTDYEKPSYSNLKTFHLPQNLRDDLNQFAIPYHRYRVDENVLYLSFNLPFNTLRTGELLLGNLGVDKPSNTQRLPCLMLGSQEESLHGILQVSFDGDVTIIPYDNTTQWKRVIVNGIVLR